MKIRLIEALLLTAIFVLTHTASANTEVVELVIEKTNTLLNSGAFDDAEDLIKEALKANASNAAIQYTAANVFGVQAQNSGMLSAMGYAKKTLKAYKEAVRLEPNNPEYRTGLMGYYLMAPGIVGGDVDSGKAEAEKIKTLDVVKGFLATAMVYQATEEEAKLLAHYQSADEQFSNNANIIFDRGIYYQQTEKYDLAHQDFSKVRTLKLDEDSKLLHHQANYQLGRTSVLSKQNIDEGISAFNLFMQNAPKDYRLPPMAWVKFRLAQLHAEKGDKETAMELMTEARKESSDSKELNKEIKKALKKLK